jgi:Domain of unknown function (DUF4340)
MFNKLSTKSLIIIFAVLLVLVVAFVFLQPHHGESTFKSQLVDLDTSQVTSISIYPIATKHKEVNLYKSGNQWYVKLKDNRTAMIPQEKIKSMYSQLTNMRTVGVAAQGESHWNEFKVDSNATQVKVYDGNKIAANLFLGKFAFTQPRSMMTYVRVADDNNVYEIDGMPSFIFNHDQNYFRNETLVSGGYTSWDTISFHYHADSSFQIVKVNNKWMMGNKPTDSAGTVSYLRYLSNLRNTEFVDNFDQNILAKPLYSVDVKSGNGIFTVYAYQADSSKVILHSTLNTEGYFDGSKNKQTEKIFVGKEKFFPKKKATKTPLKKTIRKK